jgi:hypothetical protein
MHAAVPLSLELLRQEARDELEVVVHELCLQGRDPWEFMQTLPTVDEQVVANLYEDALGDPDALARLRRDPHATEHRLLAQIALEHPPLGPAVSAIARARELGYR